ncbi:hypothetical protein ACHAXS_012119 [Conticribra weissflogii]
MKQQHHPPQLFHAMAAFEKGAKLQEQRNELASMLRRSNGGNEPDPHVSPANAHRRGGAHAPPSSAASASASSTDVPDDRTAATHASSTAFSPRAAPHRPRGLRPDYRLGDEARSASHMLVESNPYSAFQHATSLHDGDYAFVKRSDGKWTYAVLGHRSLAPSGGGGKNDRQGHSNLSHPSNYHQHYHPRNDTGFREEKMEECMVFVLNERGSTKQYKKRQFGDEIRMVSMKGLREGTGSGDAGSCAGSSRGGGSVAGGSARSTRGDGEGISKARAVDRKSSAGSAGDASSRK